MAENQELTACVVCRDVRWKSLTGLLLGRFSEVHVISASHDKRKCNRANFAGDCISTRTLPERVSAAFFHANDEILWQECKIVADRVFEFNTTGMLQPKSETILPILRRTAPSFEISFNDIEETADFLIGKRQEPPSMCRQLAPIETLPALAMLCQGYLVAGAAAKPLPDSWQQAEVTEALEEMNWVEFSDEFEHFPQMLVAGNSLERVQQPCWWLQAFSDPQRLRQTARVEWQQLAAQSFPTTLEQLIEALASGAPVDSPQLVAQAYRVLAPHLPLSELNGVAG